MRRETLWLVIGETERFLARAKALRTAHYKEGRDFAYFPKETAAVQRASMDLTRILADLRAGR